MIIALEEAKYKLTSLREPIAELSNALRIEQLRAAAEDEEQQTMDPAFWNDPDRSSRILQGIKQKKTTIENYEKLVARLEDAIALAEIAIEASDVGAGFAHHGVFVSGIFAEREGDGAVGIPFFLKMTKAEKEREIARLEKQMKEAAKMMEYEYAAVLRDQIIELRGNN